MKIIEKILLLILLLLVSLPWLQKEFSFIEDNSLSGDFVSTAKPQIGIKTWLDGTFQSEYESYLNDSIGFKNLLVRIRNQIDFSIFDVCHSEGVVKGKDGYLFEKDYIRAYFGEDFIGDGLIDQKVRELKFVQHYLKQEKNIDLVLIFEPGKATFFPEKIINPPPEKKKSNYESFVEHCDQYKVNYLDFNSYYKSLKDNYPYPLYTKYGIHWSIYGMSIIADTLLRAIENIRNIDLGDAHIDSLRTSYFPEKTDNDVGDVLNLLWELKDHDLMAYPEYSFHVDSNNIKPSVLVVGDSYYWNIFNTRIPKNLFANEAFWYFYHEVYPDSYFTPSAVENLNLQEEVEKQDIIFLTVTERFLYKFDWGFISDLYNIYGINSHLDLSSDFQGYIRKYAEWFNNVLANSKLKGVSLEENIQAHADYTFREEHPDKYYQFRGLEFYIERINNDPQWKNTIFQKTKENHSSLEEQIIKEAQWIFEYEHPEWYKNYMTIQNTKEIILSDSVTLKKLKEKADYYLLHFDEALQIEAENRSGLFTD